MESGSRASEPPERATLRVADVVGTLIALLTLLVPIVTIAHFSSVSAESLQSPPSTTTVEGN
ncbi:hypothetical protein [Leptolyngbya ohadii]|uniref:hypothetical protein n=1 Tax=Leptolyngbya ohadii TaxID=1962290 RepID=UPI00117A0613|nr:hypothetical protein [Leptolyngbya ohadii]